MAGSFGIDFASSDWQLAIQKTKDALQAPKFVGQYLPVFPTDKARVAAILTAKIAIVAAWNGDQDGSIIGSSDTSNMIRQAKLAAAAWASLGLPKGAAIFYDVETGFYFDPAAAGKWITVISAAGYMPGFYLNPFSGNNHANGYQVARRATASLKCLHWTSQRELFSYANKALTDLIIGPDYASVVPGYESECVLWQYSENQLGGLVDLDVARNLDYFWKPEPTYPYATRVAVPGALKQAANHTSKPAIDPNRKDVWLEVGADVLITGPSKHTDDDWSPCNLVKPEQVVHGFFPTKNLSR